MTQRSLKKCRSLATILLQVIKKFLQTLLKYFVPPGTLPTCSYLIGVGSNSGGMGPGGSSKGFTHPYERVWSKKVKLERGVKEKG